MEGNMRKIYIVSIILCILLGGCSSKKEVIQVPELLEPVSVNIDTAIVGKDEIYKLSSYNAQTIPYTKELSFQVSGNIGAQKVSLGDTVKKGQILITLDESNLLLQIKDLEDTIANTNKLNEYSNTLLEIDLSILKIELKKLEETIKVSSDKNEIKGLRQAIDVKKADMDIAEMKLSQAIEIQEYELEKKEKELASLNKGVGQNVITAPFSGQVAYLADLSLNEWVSEGSVIIAIADNTRPLIKSDYINESTLKLSDRYYALIDNKEYKLTYIPNDITKYYKIVLAGGTPTSTFSLDQPDNDMSLGDFTSLCIVSSYVKNTLVVPMDSIFTDPSGKYVYLMKDETRVRQPVTIGITTNALAEITDGLVEGDEVYVKN